ncbi:Catalase [Glaciecola sp. 4H-3-7+YE-5]|jgi:catalase|uniref:Catalase n=1 Tax=Paraglaciecola agarilytica NO2 TaxID=1125747 RepID=A0ABQ0IEN5_9ALTE|nr:catalase [Paraglaciecola agarilytica]AEE24236.1 Catalase [Glaciecola sp. 4H-3-7+YE-5]GAC07881.1 catalase [Paraglaciecola agarilytica NO2]
MRIKTSLLVAAALFSAATMSSAETLTRQNGAPVGDNQNSQTAGPWGPVLLQDSHLIEKLAAFDRERTPERVVHARGTGVHGYYENYVDLSDITVAAPFQSENKKTDVFVRFSAVIHGHQSPETLRDPRGFAVKFYTEQGNWDLVGNNFPVFFIRDAIKFPDMVHSLKPSPVTNAQSAARLFDFFSHVPESTHMLTHLFSDMGTPKSYLNMDGSSVHAFKFVNDKGQVKYFKLTWKTKQGQKNFTAKEAQEMQGKDFQPMTTDIYTRIGQNGETASWDLYLQTMEPEQLDDFDFNPLDTTKIWPESLIPAKKIGKLTLNRVPDNFFEETEQAAFAPSNLIPGIEPSEDRMLQGRLFSYADTQRYRIGVNAYRIPINAPRNAQINNHEQHGKLRTTNSTRDVNYQPSRRVALDDDNQYKYAQTPLSGTTQQAPFYKQRNFAQAGEKFRSFSKVEQQHLIENLGTTLAGVPEEEIRVIISAYMYNADKHYGMGVAKLASAPMSKVKATAKQLMDVQAEREKRAKKVADDFSRISYKAEL